MSADPTADPRQDYDARRTRCPVHAHAGHVTAYGHPEVLEVVTRPELYSSAVSRHLQLPNGLDGAEHAALRALTDPYLNDPAALREIETVARAVMRELLATLPRPATVEAVSDLGARYAVRVQLRWLGWQPGREEELLAWIDENRRASRSGDHAWTARVADAFDAIIRAELAPRRAQPGADVTSRLMADPGLGRPLTDEELVSILRNWTAGDLGSLALCVGVVLHGLATRPEVQARVRQGVPDAELDAVLDELLRLDDPFVANRRRATVDTALGGVPVPAGTVVHVNWTAANRDPRVFPDPDAFDPHAHAAANVVYGAGPHACPGRALSTLELRVFTQELLHATRTLSLAAPATREQAPGGGYATLPLTLA